MVKPESEKKNSLIFPFLIVKLFLSLLVVPCCLSASTATDNMINSCLTNHNIKNFTTFTGDLENDDRPTAYFRLLNFSIQNLRFAESTIPYKPIAIILPENVDQLLHALICCREGSLEIRVRSGGHSYEGTSYVATDGGPFVIIDVMNLNRVLVDLETETAWVERGATLGETYYAIVESSKGRHGFSAGSYPTVGGGGHIGGGGFGLLSRKYGLQLIMWWMNFLLMLMDSCYLGKLWEMMCFGQLEVVVVVVFGGFCILGKSNC